jgi:hypothetical protein
MVGLFLIRRIYRDWDDVLGLRVERGCLEGEVEGKRS